MNQLDQARDRVLRDNTAQTVFKHLDRIVNDRHNYAHRWVWELLQNARDAATPNIGNTVRVSLLGNNLTFFHNGLPFREDEIAHLIYYGSTKCDQHQGDPVGQFGSGFLTTHALSRLITVSGRMHDGRTFSFTLNREGRTPADLATAMDQSWEEFKSSLVIGLPHPEFTTAFGYSLDTETLTFARIGIETLARFAPYTLAFNPQLAEIEVCADLIRRKFSLTGVIERLSPEVTLVGFTGDEVWSANKIAISQDRDVAIAVLLLSVADRPELIRDDQCPRLFVAFPLIGTERFCFPVAINSERFKPHEERDGIYLGRDETQDVSRNKGIIESACNLYIELLRCAGKHSWLNASSLAMLPESERYRWIDLPWYSSLLSDKLIKPTLSVPLIITEKKIVIIARQARIPVADSGVTPVELRRLSSNLQEISQSLPAEEDTDGWAMVVQRWATVLSKDVVEIDEAWTVEKLATYVSQLGSVRVLSGKLGQDRNPIHFLLNCTDFLPPPSAPISLIVSDYCPHRLDISRTVRR